MYYEYWGLKKPPFDNVPDPSMYVDCHSSMENAIAETLFAIEEGDECIAVIVGDVGLGKTLSIRMIIDSLEQEKYKIALITNPGITFVQILQEIIGQLTGKQCDEKRKVNLLEIFNKLLFSTIEEGKKILIFIDEANAITPVNLESLRLLTNMQEDRRNLFTMVLAGQIEFARRLEHPKRANLFQRVGTYNRIDKLGSVDFVKTYVETRLKLAGAAKQIFTEDAFDKIWEHSDQGVPRLINKVSKLCLKAGETNEFTSINGNVVDQIGSRFHKLTGPAIQKRRSRKRIGDEPLPDSTALEEPDELEAGQDREEDDKDSGTSAEVISSTPEQPSSEAVESVGGLQTPAEEVLPNGELFSAQPECVEDDSTKEMTIGGYSIQIDLPEHLIRQAVSSTREYRLKLAGVLAAETLKKHPELTASFSADPVPIWQEIRNFILNQFERQAETATT